MIKTREEFLKWINEDEAILKIEFNNGSNQKVLEVKLIIDSLSVDYFEVKYQDERIDDPKLRYENAELLTIRISKDVLYGSSDIHLINDKRDSDGDSLYENYDSGSFNFDFKHSRNDYLIKFYDSLDNFCKKYEPIQDSKNDYQKVIETSELIETLENKIKEKDAIIKNNFRSLEDEQKKVIKLENDLKKQQIINEELQAKIEPLNNSEKVITAYNNALEFEMYFTKKIKASMENIIKQQESLFKEMITNINTKYNENFMSVKDAITLIAEYKGNKYRNEGN